MARGKKTRIGRAVEAVRGVILPGGGDPAERLPAVGSAPATPAASWRFPCESGDGPRAEPRPEVKPSLWGRRNRAEALKRKREARMAEHRRTRLSPVERYAAQLDASGPADVLGMIRDEARRLEGLAAGQAAAERAKKARFAELVAEATKTRLRIELYMAQDEAYAKHCGDAATAQDAAVLLLRLCATFRTLFRADAYAAEQIGEYMPPPIHARILDLLDSTDDGRRIMQEFRDDHPDADWRNSGRPRGPAVRL